MSALYMIHGKNALYVVQRQNKMHSHNCYNSGCCLSQIYEQPVFYSTYYILQHDTVSIFRYVVYKVIETCTVCVSMVFISSSVTFQCFAGVNMQQKKKKKKKKKLQMKYK